MGRVKLFTHNDLDGVGCAIVCKFLFGDNTDIEFHDYDTIDNAVKNFLTYDELFDENNKSKYDKIFITDISVSEEVADMIDVLINNNTLTAIVDDFHDLKLHSGIEFYLLDHHATAKRLNTRVWAEVEEYLPGFEYKSCGASNFLRYLEKTELYFQHPDKTEDFRIDKLEYFVDIVRLWDTWEWTTPLYNNQDKCNLAPKFNKLLKYEGKNKFLSNCLIELLSSDNEFPYKLSAINNMKLNVLDNVEQSYIESKLKDVQVVINEKWDCTIGIVFASQYVSNLGHAIIDDENASVDVAVMIDINSIPGSTYISFRSVKNYDCSIIAKEFGGGGHPQSSGAVVLTKDLPRIIKNLTEEDIEC